MFLKNLSSIQKNTLLILLVTGLIKIPLILRDIVMAGYFGVDKNIDIYLYSLVVPTFVAAITSTSFNYFVIPSYLKIKIQNGKTQAQHYMQQFLFLTILFTIILIAGLGLLLPHFLIYVNPKIFIDEATIIHFFHFSYLVSIFIGLQLISVLLTFFLQAEHCYMSSLLPQTFAPIISICFLILYGKTYGVISIIYGGLIGILLNLFFLFFLSYRLKLLVWQKTSILTNRIKINYSQFWILNIAFIMPAFVSVVDQHMAVSLGEGQLTTLAYGIRLPDGISEILCAGLGTAIFSHFSEWANEHNHQKLSEAIQKAIISLTLFIIPLSIFIFLYANPIISLLFKRGVFSQVAAINVSQILQVYCFTTYFTVIGTIGSKAISAFGKTYFFIANSLIVFSIKIFLNWILIKSMGLNGIAFSTVLALITNSWLVFNFLEKKGIKVFNKSFTQRLLKCLLFSVVFLIILLLFSMISKNFIPLLQVLLAASMSVVLILVFLKINFKLLYSI